MQRPLPQDYRTERANCESAFFHNELGPVAGLIDMSSTMHHSSCRLGCGSEQAEEQVSEYALQATLHF
jgi:hypothetical protein